MANKLDNLINFTSDQNREEAAKNGAKGGKKSGVTRRTNADVRKMLYAALFEEYTDKKTGKKIEGIQGIVNALIVKSLNGKDKDQLAAIKYIFNLLGLDKSKLEEEKSKAEIELIRARVVQLASGQGSGAVDEATRKEVESIISEFGDVEGEPVGDE